MRHWALSQVGPPLSHTPLWGHCVLQGGRKRRKEGRRLPRGDTVTYILTASRPPSCPAHLLAGPAPAPVFPTFASVHTKPPAPCSPDRQAGTGGQTELAQCCLLSRLPGTLSVSSPRTRPPVLSSFHLSPGSRLLTRSGPPLCDPWTVARQPPPSMGFSRQQDWSGLPFPPPGGPSDSGIKPLSPMSPAWAGSFFTTGPSGKLSSLAEWG